MTGGSDVAASASLAQLLLELHRQGFLIAQIFFGLFLLPLGYLIWKSNLFPRALGISLMIGCGGYLAALAATYLSPRFESSLAPYLMTIGGFAELSFVLWLLVVGARPRVSSKLLPSGAQHLSAHATGATP